LPRAHLRWVRIEEDGGEPHKAPLSGTGCSEGSWRILLPTELVSVINAINSIIIESCNAQMRNVAAGFGPWDAGCRMQDEDEDGVPELPVSQKHHNHRSGPG